MTSVHNPLEDVEPPPGFGGAFPYGCVCGAGFESAGDLPDHVARVFGHLRICPVHVGVATPRKAVYLALEFVSAYYEEEEQQGLVKRLMAKYFDPAESTPGTRGGAPSCGLC